MKAFETLMFILIFNSMVVTMIGLGIFSTGIKPVSIESMAVTTIVGAVFGTFAAAAIFSYIGAKFTTTHVAYTLFSTVFWGTYGTLISFLNSIQQNIVDAAPGMMFTFSTILTVVVGYIFASALIQMASGGWKSYK